MLGFLKIHPPKVPKSMSFAIKLCMVYWMLSLWWSRNPLWDCWLGASVVYQRYHSRWCILLADMTVARDLFRCVLIQQCQWSPFIMKLYNHHIEVSVQMGIIKKISSLLRKSPISVTKFWPTTPPGQLAIPTVESQRRDSSLAPPGLWSSPMPSLRRGVFAPSENWRVQAAKLEAPKPKKNGGKKLATSKQEGLGESKGLGLDFDSCFSKLVDGIPFGTFDFSGCRGVSPCSPEAADGCRTLHHEFKLPLSEAESRWFLESSTASCFFFPHDLSSWK